MLDASSHIVLRAVNADLVSLHKSTRGCEEFTWKKLLVDIFGWTCDQRNKRWDVGRNRTRLVSKMMSGRVRTNAAASRVKTVDPRFCSHLRCFQETPL